MRRWNGAQGRVCVPVGLARGEERRKDKLRCCYQARALHIILVSGGFNETENRPSGRSGPYRRQLCKVSLFTYRYLFIKRVRDRISE